MCGIAGFVDYHEKASRRILSRMLSTIIYRGPDSEGMFVEDMVALGSRRLSIIDLVTGDQPISNEDGSITVVFNGEIYNYQSLREKLLKKGHIFKTQSDTEVLVHLYEEYGSDFSGSLNGMFAFALWDKNLKQLVVGRDQIGIKPLYYYCKKNLLIFGSELKTILLHPSVSKKINRESIQMYASLGYITGENSIFADIYKLQPGQTLTFSESGITFHTYWSLRQNLHNNVNDLEALLKNSIILQSRADVPVGVLLSGGIDSSLIAYYTSRVQNKPIETFSISFREKSFNEEPYAVHVARQLDTKHHSEVFTPVDIINLFSTVTKKLDEPLADTSLFPTYKVSELARRYVKVVLSGDGGDELFGGYPTYQGHLLTDLLDQVPLSITALIQATLDLIPKSFTNYPISEVTNILLQGRHLAPSYRHLVWMQLLFAGVQHWLHPSYQVGGWEDALLEAQMVFPDSVTTIQALDMQTYLRDDLLVKSDRASMYNSLELRVPFLDINLIKFAFSQKSNRHLDLFQTKKMLRRLAKKIHPKEITVRPKKGFGIPLAEWMCNQLREFITTELENEDIYEIFNKKLVMRAWSEHTAKKKNHSRKLWTVVMLSAWLREWMN